MSSPAVAPAGPLTTIFTPLYDCFATLPASWSIFATRVGQGTTYTSCYWSLPASCYPSGGNTWAVGTGDFSEYSTISLPAHIHYTPAAMPYGFAIMTTFGTKNNATSVAGCLSGWSTYGYDYCTSAVTAIYSNPSVATTGAYTAVLPQFRITWAASDLDTFTPLWAPILARSSVTLVQATSTISIPSTFTTSASTITPPASTKQTAKGPSNTNPPTPSASSTNEAAFSNGAIAGLACGTSAAVFFLLASVWFFYRLGRNKKKLNLPPSPRTLDNNGKIFARVGVEELYGVQEQYRPQPSQQVSEMSSTQLSPRELDGASRITAFARGMLTASGA